MHWGLCKAPLVWRMEGAGKEMQSLRSGRWERGKSGTGLGHREPHLFCWPLRAFGKI